MWIFGVPKKVLANPRGISRRLDGLPRPLSEKLIKFPPHLQLLNLKFVGRHANALHTTNDKIRIAKSVDWQCWHRVWVVLYNSFAWTYRLIQPRSNRSSTPDASLKTAVQSSWSTDLMKSKYSTVIWQMYRDRNWKPGRRGLPRRCNSNGISRSKDDGLAAPFMDDCIAVLCLDYIGH